MDWSTWMLADEWRPSKLQHYWERPEESWKLEETSCHSNSCERPSANTNVKNSQCVNNNNDNNMKVAFIPIVIGALGTVTEESIKGLEDLEIRRRVKTIQTTVLLRSTRILRRVPETWGDLLSLKLQWKTISNTDVKISQGVNNNNDYNNDSNWNWNSHSRCKRMACKRKWKGKKAVLSAIFERRIRLVNIFIISHNILKIACNDILFLVFFTNSVLSVFELIR